MIKIEIIPALNDNYIFLLINESEKKAVVVDPTLATPVIEYCEKLDYNIEAILNTHHHIDHVGGNKEIQNYFNCPIFAHEQDQHRIPCITNPLKDGDKVQVFGYTFEVKWLPGHTTGVIAYYCNELSMLFSNDIVFGLGCGRMFEGSPEKFWNSLDFIKNLPEETKIYFSHEYTKSNAKFVKSLNLSHEPTIKRVNGLLNSPFSITSPSTVKIEKNTNPFLRCDQDDLKKDLHLTNKQPFEVFAYLRKLKDRF